MAHGGPMPQPSPDGLGRQRLVERLACGASGLRFAVLRYVTDALVESEISRVLRKVGDEIRKRAEHRQAAAPVLALPCPEECRLTHEIVRSDALHAQPENRFGDYKTKVVLEPGTQAILPVRFAIGVARLGRHPYFAVT